MFLTILIIVGIIGFAVNQSLHDKEIIDTGHSNMIAKYEERYKGHRIAATVFSVVMAIGIVLFFVVDGLGGYVLAFLLTVVGLTLGIVFWAAYASTHSQYQQYASMSENSYKRLQETTVAKQNSESMNSNANNSLSLFDKPPCPKCGSSNTKMTDDYMTKQAGKIVGKIALSLVLSNYTNMSLVQRHMMGQNYSRTVRVDPEFICSCCGYRWKPNKVIPKQTVPIAMERKVTTISSVNNDSNRIVSHAPNQEQNTLKDDVQTLKSLLAEGSITQEEYNQELHKLLIS